MKENRRDDYLEHIRQAASDALIFVEGLNKMNSLKIRERNKR